MLGGRVRLLEGRVGVVRAGFACLRGDPDPVGVPPPPWGVVPRLQPDVAPRHVHDVAAAPVTRRAAMASHVPGHDISMSTSLGFRGSTSTERLVPERTAVDGAVTIAQREPPKRPGQKPTPGRRRRRRRRTRRRRRGTSAGSPCRHWNRRWSGCRRECRTSGCRCSTRT